MRAHANPWQKVLLGTVRYVVPLYQRPYVWEKREEPENDRLGPFWDDVKQTVDAYIDWRRLVDEAGGEESRVAAMTPHFFGAIVVDRPVKEGQVATHEVIDGQQRLTTTQLFLAAATQLCESKGLDAHASRLRKLWRQDDDLGLSGLEQFKLSPTRRDRDVFLRVLTGTETSADRKSTIARAYAYFNAELEEWAVSLPPGDEQIYFDALRDVAYDHLLLVDIHLEDGDNAQGIFESLNAQGEKLLALDLVKNEVFRRAKSALLDLERLEETTWAPEFNSEFWRQPVRQGRYFRPRAELFLMHWLMEQKSAEVSATGLYVEFRKIAAAQLKDGTQTLHFIERFIADARTYRGFEEGPLSATEDRFFRRRRILDASMVYPIALRLYRLESLSVLTAERRLRGMAALESWLVRRMICADTPKNYNNVAVQILRAMDSKSDDPVAALFDYLKAADDKSSWWPDDARFVSRLVSDRFYKTLNNDREVLVLETVEARLRTTKTESVTFEQKLTIEHVIPQSWESEWPLPELPGSGLTEADRELLEDANRRRRIDHIHRLGNLTLVTGSLNPSMGKDPWLDKRSALQEFSTLLLNNALVTGADTDPASDGLTFDEDRIERRGRRMAELLALEWPGPDSQAWA